MLGLDADLDTLVGLDVEDETIGIDLLLALVEEEERGRRNWIMISVSRRGSRLPDRR